MTDVADLSEKSGATMTILRADRGDQRGSVLVMATLLSFAMFVLGLSYLGAIMNLQSNISAEISDVQSRYGAMAAAGERYAAAMSRKIIHDDSGRWKNWYDKVKIRGTIAFDNPDYIDYGMAQGFTVTGYGLSTFSGWGYNTIKRISISCDLSTFADYLYLSDRERDPVRNDIIRFWTPDTLDGKVHSNDTLHISGSPRFMKRVTSSASVVDPVNTYAQFDEGLGLNAPEIFFPDQYQEIRNYNGYPGWGTHSPDSATEITFNGNQIYRRYCGWRIIDDDTLFLCTPNNISDAFMVLIPPTGALFIEGKVIVKADRGGEDIMDPSFPPSQGFAGRLTLASSDTMIIPDNLVYRSANPDNSVPDTSRDVLGLISENYIMIGADVADTVYINAAMAAINGSITVQDIYDYGHYNEKQSLFIYGSLAQRNRGLVHSSYGGGLRGFIEKDYHYDYRLQTSPPPHFLPTRQNPKLYYESFYD